MNILLHVHLSLMLLQIYIFFIIYLIFHILANYLSSLFKFIESYFHKKKIKDIKVLKLLNILL